jgi:hypothetical protein
MRLRKPGKSLAHIIVCIMNDGAASELTLGREYEMATFGHIVNDKGHIASYTRERFAEVPVDGEVLACSERM